MTVLSEEAASRRLRAVDQSQESIETTSLWIMHHKDSADTILHSWMNVFRVGRLLLLELHFVKSSLNGVIYLSL